MHDLAKTLLRGLLLAVALLGGAARGAPDTIASFTLDADPGWAREGLWAFGVPTGGGSYNGYDPTSGYTGPYVFGYNLAGDYENNLPARYLTMDALDCSLYDGVLLSFWRWLGVERSAYDRATVEVSNNGATWTTVWQNPDSNLGEDAWTNVVYDISAVADGQPTVYVRWGMGPTDFTVTYAGWNIDDISLRGHSRDSLAVSPAAGLVSAGPVGGPYAPGSITYTAVNRDTGPLDWSAWVDADWVEVVPAAGTLPANGGSETVVLAINAAADGLPAGIHEGRLVISNHVSGVTQTRAISLTARAPEPETIAFFDLDADPGWTRGNGWSFGRPLGFGGQYGRDPVGGYTGNNVFGNNLYGDYPNNQAWTYVTTPAFDCGRYQDVAVSFWRWLGVEEGIYDRATFEVSTDGSDWRILWQNPDDVPIMDTAWTQMVVNISAYADLADRVYLRWGLTTDGGVTYPGWNLDDIRIRGMAVTDLAVQPNQGFTAAGYRGGPFPPTQMVYTVRNFMVETLAWEAAVDVPWITVAPSSGTLAPEGATPVTVTINAAAESLPAGPYPRDVIFRKTGTVQGIRRAVTLTVFDAPRIALAPDRIDVTNTVGGTVTRTMTVSNLGSAPLTATFTPRTTSLSLDGSPSSGGADGMGGERLGAASPSRGSERPRHLEGEPPRVPRDFTQVQAGHDYVSGELLVRLRPGKSVAAQADSVRVLGGTLTQTYRLVPDLCRVVLDKGVSVADALVSFNASDQVLYAEPNYIVQALGTPDDTDFERLWGMHNTGQTGGTPGADIDAIAAWDLQTGSRDIVVAVIDTGVDYTHPDLAANMWTNPGEIPGNGIDDDGNGYVDDVHGYDFVNSDGDPMDDHNHGTHCAGTVGAVGNNGEGVVGVCWRVSIMALKFLNASGSGNTADAISCVEYATANKARVLSNSWGGGGFSQAMEDAITAAAQGGIAFVAAAGNDSADNDQGGHYPSNYDVENVISVMATDHNDARSSFSNYGLATVHLGAPGSAILSTVRGGGYASYNGTSMATPHVAGAAALLMAANPLLQAVDVKQILMDTVEPTLSGWCASGGRLNMHNALLRVTPPWIGVEPEVVRDLAPGASTPVTLTFSGQGQEPGIYNGSIQADSNDPLHPVAAISLSMLIEPDDLDVTPAVSFRSSGIEGGPFSPLQQTYSVRNRGTAPLPWTLLHNANWVSVSPSSGTLAGLAESVVTVGIAALAETLPFATYSETLVFSNAASGATQTRAVELDVQRPPLDEIVTFRFDENPGWTAEGRWQFGQPTGRGSGKGGPTSGYTGNQVYGYHLDGDYDSNMPRWNLTSTAVDCSAYALVELGFQRWLGVEGNAYDHATLSVSTDGANWTEIWRNPAQTIDDGAWVEVRYDISAYADGKSTVYVRWGMGPMDESVQYCGWNLDDVAFYGRSMDSLAIDPVGGLQSEGYRGGPFTPASKAYTLTNTGGDSLNWTAAVSDPWLAVAPDAGTLPGGGDAPVTVALAPAALELPAGAYDGRVTFQNSAGGLEQHRYVRLNVLSIPDDTNTVRAAHTAAGFYVGEINRIHCQFYRETNQLLWVQWRPALPAWWEIVSTQGDGNPRLVSGNVFLGGPFEDDPVAFSFDVVVPSNAAAMQHQVVTAEANFMFDSMTVPDRRRAGPDPLVLRRMHYIDAFAGLGGWVSPSGRVAVASGASTGITIRAAAYFSIQEVTVDGEPQGPLGYYAFNNVSADGHRLDADFLAAAGRYEVPLWWLDAHGFTNGGFDAHLDIDHDGDGAETWKEWHARTDPTNASSVFRVRGAARDAGGRMAFTFASEAGVIYEIVGRHELTTGTWELLPYRVTPEGLPGKAPLPGTGGDITVYVELDGGIGFVAARIAP